MADDYVTTGEFGRFRADQAQWRGEIAKQITDGFSGIHTRLDAMNGRGRDTAAKVDIVEADVERVMKHGCGQYERHLEVLGDTSVAETGVSKKKQVGIAAGTGAGIVGFIELMRAVVTHVWK
jgi:hypothetical protein